MLKWAPFSREYPDNVYPIAIIYMHDTGVISKRMVVYDDNAPKDDSVMIRSDEPFEPYLWKRDKQSIRMCLAAGQGAGKSHKAGSLLSMITNIDPKLMKPITVFSRVPYDPSIDKPRFIIETRQSRGSIVSEKKVKYPIRPDLIEYAKIHGILPKVEDLRNQWLIFDDIEDMGNKQLTQYCMGLRDSALLTGRHSNIDLILCQHNILSGIKNAHVINECNIFILYPNSSGLEKIIKFLKYKIGMNKQQIELATGTRSRCLVIRNEHPRVCITDHMIFKIM